MMGNLYVAANSRDVSTPKEFTMNQIIYLVGLVVVVMAVLSFVGLR